MASQEEVKFKVYLKDFFLPKHVEFIFSNIIPKLKHGNDGIIFTKKECPYYPGTCEQILKWKPHTVNSVDFILKFIT
jgi:hypothetical protein